MRLVFLLAFVSFCAFSQARQQYRGLLPNGNSVPCPPGDPHCEENHVCAGIGHESCGGGVLTPGLNPFGKVRRKTVPHARFSRKPAVNVLHFFLSGHEYAVPSTWNCSCRSGAFLVSHPLGWEGFFLFFLCHLVFPSSRESPKWFFTGCFGIKAF